MRKFPDLEQPPVREDWVRSVAIARTRLIAFVGVKGLPKPAFTSGIQMLVHSAADGSTKTPANRATEWPLLEEFRTVGLKA